MMHDLGNRPDPGARDIGRGQPLFPGLGVGAGKRFLDDRAQCRLVLAAARPVGKARVVEHIRPAKRTHQAGELLFGHHRQHQIALAGLEAVAGRLAGRRQVAVLPVLVAGDRIFGNRPGQKAQRRIEHRHIDKLAGAGMAALEEGACHGKRRGHAGDRVAQGKAGAGRAHLGVAGDRHDARHRLQLAVERGSAALRALLAKTRDGAIDQPRIDRAQHLIAEPEPLHDPGAKILPDDICPFGELFDDFDGLPFGQVEGQAALVGVDAEKRGSQPLRRPFRAESANNACRRPLSARS